MAVLVAYCTLSTVKTSASLAAAALSVLAASIVSLLSYFEHERSPAPSSLLFLFLLLTSIFDIARVRTLWTIGETAALAGIFSAGLAMKSALVVLESWSKRRYLAYGSRDSPREELAGFLSRTVFLWLGPLLLNGFRNWLVASDLSPIDRALRSDKRPSTCSRIPCHNCFRVSLSSVAKDDLMKLFGRAIRTEFVVCRDCKIDRLGCRKANYSATLFRSCDTFTTLLGIIHTGIHAKSDADLEK